MRDHGYGAASFLASVSSPLGILPLLNFVVERQKAHPLQALEAIVGAQGKTLAGTWLEFAGSFADRKVLARTEDVRDLIGARAADNGVSFASPSETVKRQVYISGDLSMRFTGVGFGFRPPADAKFVAEVTGNRDTMLLVHKVTASPDFRVLYGPGERLAGPVKKAEVTGLGARLQSGEFFVVTVVNAQASPPAYDGVTPTVLELRLQTGPELLAELKQATQVEASVQGKFKCQTAEPQLVCPTEVGATTTKPGELWTWTGASLKTSDTYWNSGRTIRYHSEITLDFSDTGQLLRRAEVNGTATGGTDERRFRLVLTNLKHTDRLESDRAATYLFELTGAEAKSNLTVDWSYGDVGKPPRITSTDVDASDTRNPLRLSVMVSRPK